MIKNLLKKIKEKDGAISIIAVTMILIIVICMTAYVDIARRSWTLDELQSDIDTAGINALQTSVDLKELRTEILGIDRNNNIDSNTGKTNLSNYESQIDNKFAQYFSKLVSTNNKSIVKSWRILNQNAYFQNTNNGLGTDTKSVPQICLDTTMIVTVPSSKMFDNKTTFNQTFNNKFANKNFNVQYNGKNQDGETELLIRSVTKLVYR